MSNQPDITQVPENVKQSSFNDLLPKNVWLEVVSQWIVGSWEGYRVEGRATKGTLRRSQEARRLRHMPLPHQKPAVHISSSKGYSELRFHR